MKRRAVDEPEEKAHRRGGGGGGGSSAAAIMRAIEQDDLAGLRAALEGGCDPTRTLPSGDTALSYACRKGALFIVKWMVDAVKCVNLLMGGNISVDQPNESGATPLHIAAQEGHLEVVRVLIQEGSVGLPFRSVSRKPRP